MYKFSEISLKRLSTCHADIRKVLHKAIRISNSDFMVVCGHRTEREQEEAYRKGASKLQYPDSKHNKIPSLAVDVCPWEGGLMWGEYELWCHVVGAIMEGASNLNIKLKWGGNWISFVDMPHFELGG